MNGGKNRHPPGYTILEVMIVLTISGVMFLIAAQFIGGKQGASSFTAGVNDMASQVQNVLEQVTDGQYSDVPLGCTFNGVTTNAGAPANPGQGTNAACVFLGKMLHFTGTIPTHTYETYSIAGGRVDSSGNPITSLTAADPAVITALTTKSVVPQSLNIRNITINGSATQSFAIGFFQGQGAISGGTLQNGAQTVSLYYDSNDSAPSNGAYNGSILSLQQANSIDICVTDGIRYADIVLGGNSNAGNASQLVANIVLDGKTKPATC